MKKMRLINSGYANLMGLAVVVILIFCVLFIGAYINGTVSETLVSTYPTNKASGSMSSDYWHNGTSNSNDSRNVTLTTYASRLDGTNSRFYIYANGTHNIIFNLTVNGVSANNTATLTAGWGYNHTVSSLITAGNIGVADEYINFSFDVNSSESQIYIMVMGDYYVDSDWRDGRDNESTSRIYNISTNWDTNLDIVQVVVIITILAMAIGAIFLFTKFRG